MIGQLLDLSNPYLWVFLAGLFWGLASGRLPFLYSRRHSGRRLKTGSWFFLAAFFSLGLLAVMGIFFAPRGGLFGTAPVSFEVFSGLDWLFVFGAALAAGLLARRFPRAGGIPVAAAAAAVILFFHFALASWRPFAPGEAVLEQKVLLERQNREDGGWTSAQFLKFSDGREMLVTLEGRGYVPVIEQLFFPRVFFFAGRGLFYRLPGLRAGDAASGPVFSIGDAGPAAGPAQGFFDKLLFQFPGKYSCVDSWENLPAEGETFRYIFDGQGNVSQAVISINYSDF